MESKFILASLLIIIITVSFVRSNNDSNFSANGDAAGFYGTCEDDYKSLVDTLVKLTVAYGMLGRHNEAQEMKKLDNYEQHMTTIVTQLYSANITNIRRTLDIFWDTSCVGVAKGVAVLYEEMKKQAHLSEPEVLVFQKFLQDIGCGEEVKTTTFIIEHYADKIVERWVEDIRTGNCSHVYSFTLENPSNYAAVLVHIPELVRRGLNDNVSSFHPILEFVKASPFLELGAVGYLAIVQELKNLNQEHSESMLMVSYWVHAKMESNTQKIKENKMLMEKFAKLKGEIPAVIQNIFWKSICTFRNLHWMEYMYATVDSAGKNKKGAVFTWMPGNKPRAAKWVLEAKYSEDKLSFLVKNKHLSGETSNYNLCVAGTLPKVVTCDDHVLSTTLHHIQWTLEPTTIETLRWSGDAFKVKSCQSDGESNYISQENSEYHLGLKRREVQVSGTAEDSVYWEVECL